MCLITTLGSGTMMALVLADMLRSGELSSRVCVSWKRGSYPSIVKVSYTSQGNSNSWANVCTDGGSGADADVTIYEARSSSIDLQNVRGFGAVASYGHYPTTPYFLKAYFTYWTEKPLEKIHMHNVE